MEVAYLTYVASTFGNLVAIAEDAAYRVVPGPTIVPRRTSRHINSTQIQPEAKYYCLLTCLIDISPFQIHNAVVELKSGLRSNDAYG